MRVRNHHSARNYGFDRVCFTSVLPIVSRVGLEKKAKAVRATSKRTLNERECSFELKGSELPTLVCDWLTLMVTRAPANCLNCARVGRTSAG